MGTQEHMMVWVRMVPSSSGEQHSLLVNQTIIYKTIIGTGRPVAKNDHHILLGFEQFTPKVSCTFLTPPESLG